MISRASDKEKKEFKENAFWSFIECLVIDRFRFEYDVVFGVHRQFLEQIQNLHITYLSVCPRTFFSQPRRITITCIPLSPTHTLPQFISQEYTTGILVW